MLTVLFATYNGSGTLPNMLRSLVRLSPPKGGWKIIAVDNASTDNSHAILESFLDKLPLTILTEYKQGKNHALNSGIKYIEGDWVVLTDDDVIADPMWLEQLITQASTQKNYDIFAGLILPFWTKVPEKWVLEWVNHQVVYALTPPHLLKGKIPSSLVWGPNMMVRASIFMKGYQFDTNVGPDGSENYKMGSETSFVGKLETEGYKSFYIPEAKVQHTISEREMDYHWVLNRAIRSGRSNFYDTSTTTKKFFGVPRYLYRKYLTKIYQLALAHLRLNKKNIFIKHWELNMIKGAILESKSNK